MGIAGAQKRKQNEHNMKLIAACLFAMFLLFGLWAVFHNFQGYPVSTHETNMGNRAAPILPHADLNSRISQGAGYGITGLAVAALSNGRFQPGNQPPPRPTNPQRKATPYTGAS